MHRATVPLVIGSRVYSPGDVLADVDPRRLAMLIRRGQAVEVSADGPIETAERLLPERETADAPPRRQRKRVPKPPE